MKRIRVATTFTAAPPSLSKPEDERHEKSSRDELLQSSRAGNVASFRSTLKTSHAEYFKKEEKELREPLVKQAVDYVEMQNENHLSR